MEFFRRKGFITGCGLAVAAALLAAGTQTDGNVSGVLFGLGGATGGLALANLVSWLAERRYPTIRKTREIEDKDERTAWIRDKAGAKTNTLVMWLMLPVMLIMILLHVELWVILSLSGIVLLNGILNLYYTAYYNKRL